MKNYLLLISLLFGAHAITAQQNYYISPSGNNNSNGSLATPWKTIQYGVDNISANDTINILAGTYTEKVNIEKSNIYVRNHQGAAVLLSGTGVTSQVAMLQIIDGSNVTVAGLEIANNLQKDAQGILVEGSGHDILIENCTLHDIHFSTNPNASVNSGTNAQGIIVYGTKGNTPLKNIRIKSNHLYNCRLGYSEGIAVNGNVDGFEISGNEVHDLTNIGIDAIGHEGTSSSAATDQARNGLIKNNKVYRCISAYATSAGLYVDGGKNIVIENNSSYHNGYGVEVGCENKGKTTDSIIVRNNIFYDNEVCAVALGGYAYPSGSGKVTNSTITNNTCYKNNFKNDWTGELYLSYSEKSVIENNIFYLSDHNTFAYAELTQPSLKFNYNLFFSNNGAENLHADWNGVSYNSFTAFKGGTLSNTNSKIGNPQFANGNIAAPDLHITATSAAVDAGDPLFVPALSERDIDNEMRVTGTVDCGADEYYAASTGYIFIGNGYWSESSNWSNSLKPPALLTGNAKIIVDPVINGECILNVEQHITGGAQLTIQPDKKFIVNGSVSISN
ncbi:MAG: right-handed parallel beta-helix repeat-containing protein [Ferruginibacter sp.]